MQNQHNIYDIRQLVFSYQPGFILNIPELAIKQGSSLGLAGVNGSGKSTLLKLLAFLETAQQGCIYYNNALPSKLSQLHGRITYLLQSPYLLKRSVFENIAYPLKIKKMSSAYIHQEVAKTLQLVGLDPDSTAKRQWHELSGGEAQRVSLASRLILRPEVLLLDEPVSNVDPINSNIIKDVITNIKKEQTVTLIIASHNLFWLNNIADEILIMHEGRIIGSGEKNIICGPWIKNKNNLWLKKITPDIHIIAPPPPDKNASAILNPSEVILSQKKQNGLSAQNVLEGIIVSLSELGANKIKVVVSIQGQHIISHITHQSARSLKIMPGKKIWIIFKATSLHWC